MCKCAEDVRNKKFVAFQHKHERDFMAKNDDPGRSGRVGRSLDARRTIIMSKEAILEKPTNSSGDDFDDGALATSSSSSSTPENNSISMT